MLLSSPWALLHPGWSVTRAMTVGAFMLALTVILQFCERSHGEKWCQTYSCSLYLPVSLSISPFSLSLYAYIITIYRELFVMANFAKIACMTRTRRLMPGWTAVANTRCGKLWNFFVENGVGRIRNLARSRQGNCRVLLWGKILGAST